MKNLTYFLVFFGLLCHASPSPKDTIYTNIETLMKEVRTTKNKTASYYLSLKDGNHNEVKVRIDLKKIDAEIPLYKTGAFDIKKLLSLQEQSLVEPKQKLAVFDAKMKEKIWLEKALGQLNAQLKELQAVDSLSRDSIAIDSIQKLKDLKALEMRNTQKEATTLFNQYDKMMDSLLGNLRSQYRQRLNNAIEEAYQKIENKETLFHSVDDDARIWDIRLDLLKIDATREMIVPRRINYKNTTEKVTAGKEYYILHFAEFGTMFKEDKVKKVFSAIKLWEFHLNPYLVDKQFGLVCDDQDRTQHYINSIVDYKNYDGSLIQTDDTKFENTFLNDVHWVSQFGSLYEGTGCWPDRCCNRAANEILKQSGTGTDRTRQVVIAQSPQEDCGNITMINKEKFDEGVKILKTSLIEHKLPMLIGVHHPNPVRNKDKDIVGWKEDCCGNIPNITNHYVVVVGMGYDEQKQKNYFRFYEVGTSYTEKGTGTNNRLFLNENMNILKGTTTYKSNPGYYYIMTELRKNHGKTY